MGDHTQQIRTPFSTPSSPGPLSRGLPGVVSKVVMYGGSHGGFLTAHVCGQHPGLLRAVAMRNPVLHIGLMFHESDIPDCCSYEASTPATMSAAEAEGLMRQMSPIQHVDKVEVPTLLALGQDDLWVPPPQGRAWVGAGVGSQRQASFFCFQLVTLTCSKRK